MTIATQTHFFPWQYVVEEDGQVIATIKYRFFSHHAKFMVGEEVFDARVVPARSFRIQRRTTFRLESQGQTVATAQTAGLFLRVFEVEFDGRKLALKAKRMLSRNYDVLDDERRIGEIRGDNSRGVGLFIDLPDDMPLAQRLFLLWLVVFAWHVSRGAS